jgi:hypothetical protein
MDLMSQHVALAKRAAIHTQLPDHESFFRYNSGRWLYNESERKRCFTHLTSAGICYLTPQMQN